MLLIMRNRILDKISKFNNIAIVGFGKEGKSTYKFIRSVLKDIKLTIIDKFNAYDCYKGKLKKISVCIL